MEERGRREEGGGGEGVEEKQRKTREHTTNSFGIDPLDLRLYNNELKRNESFEDLHSSER